MAPALSLQLPSEYGWTLLAATSTFFVNNYIVMLVSRSRKAAGIKYPNHYATPEQADKDPNAFKFNCAQRAHGNFLEHQPTALAALLIAGLRFPIPAAIIGAGWTLCRIAYAYGYTSKGPMGRIYGSGFSNICELTLQLMAVYTAVKMIL